MATVAEYVEKIMQWELDNGETFVDYFAHDNINRERWVLFLRAKGFEKQADAIVAEKKQDGYVSQETQFDIFGFYEDLDFDKWKQNTSLIVEYILMRGAAAQLDNFLTSKD